jgi:Rrf2 family nitric oxide-sensitive transcriptional repressor
VLDEALLAFLRVLDGYSLADVLERRGDFSHLLRTVEDPVGASATVPGENGPNA